MSSSASSSSAVDAQQPLDDPAAARPPKRKRPKQKNQVAGCEIHSVRLDNGLEAVTEGSATVLFDHKEEVFYNPVQETNRDLSILVIDHYLRQLRRQPSTTIHPSSSSSRQSADESSDVRQPVRILEALSATGLRSIRYWKELGLGDGDRIVANDIDADAVAAIRRNLDYNGVCAATQVVPSLGDANAVMYAAIGRNEPFDIIDLDPYGTAAPFLEPAVQALTSGGLLCVTCTDLGVLAGSHPDVCLAKYGSVNVRGKHCHEMALRIVLATLVRAAAKFKRIVEPVACFHIDFYVRLFVRVFPSNEYYRQLGLHLATVYQCLGCTAHRFVPLMKAVAAPPASRSCKINAQITASPATDTACPDCGAHAHLGGPIYTPPLYHTPSLHAMLAALDAPATAFHNTRVRLRALLTLAIGELPSPPLFYNLAQLARVMHLQCPPSLLVRSALLNAGHRVSISHTDPMAIKTTAPMSLIWDVLRKWHEQRPAKDHPNTPGAVLLAKPISHDISFAPHPDAKRAYPDFPQFPMNPADNWGPRRRARKIQRTADSESMNK